LNNSVEPNHDQEGDTITVSDFQSQRKRDAGAYAATSSAVKPGGSSETTLRPALKRHFDDESGGSSSGQMPRKRGRT